MRPIRILPLAMIGIASLFALKAAAMLLNGGLSLAGIGVAVAQTGQGASQAEPPMAEADAGTGAGNGSQPEARTDGKAADAAPPPKPPQGRLVKPGEETYGSKAAVLDRLSERSRDLDERARELDLKENLLLAAEKRIAVQLEELRSIKTVIETAARKEEERRKGQLKGLVTMYENMKPKDAARIFNGLSMPVLMDLVDQMNARKMAEILGEMTSEAAERLTVEMAKRANGKQGETEAVGELPKILGNNPT